MHSVKICSECTKGSKQCQKKVEEEGGFFLFFHTMECGSCWSFSAAETIEGAYAIKNKINAVSLSNQQLLSCSSTDKGYGNDGCNGGFARNGMYYVLKTSGGIESWQDYPYVGKVASCKAKKSKYVTGISEITAVKQGDEQVLEQSVYENGPNSVAIDASAMQQG